MVGETVWITLWKGNVSQNTKLNSIKAQLGAIILPRKWSSYDGAKSLQYCNGTLIERKYIAFFEKFEVNGLKLLLHIWVSHGGFTKWNKLTARAFSRAQSNTSSIEYWIVLLRID